MKKRLFRSMGILCLLLNLNSVKIYAQVDTSTTQKLLEYIFDPIDKTQVPTGYLEEYGCPIIPMATFNGTLTDSNRIDMNLWRTLYFQLHTSWAQTTTNPLPAITSVNTTIKANAGNNVPVAIPLLIGEYDAVKSNAFSNSLLSYNTTNKKIYDVSGRSQLPYETKNLFAAAALRSGTRNGSDSFIVKSSMIWNNTGKTISQLQINFDNGDGLQTVTIGTAIPITYSDTGYKRWTIKVTLSDNSVLQCYNDYYVAEVSGWARYSSGQTVLPAWGTINAVVGLHKGARILVNYSSLNYSNTLRKPLIVVEGFDVSAIAPSLQGNYSMRDFIAGINAPLLDGYDFNEELDETAGYDIVFVDFNDGADDIIANAAIVQEVIDRVNTNKVLDGRFGNIRQQNVVMGLSMGGLCARYALADLTKNSVDTETRLLITHDSPHRGANIPLGLQYLIRMSGDVHLFGWTVRDVYPDYDDAISLLDAPATGQMLLYRSASTTTFDNNTFLDGAYRTMVTFTSTDPQPTYRFVATAQGNECANPLFSPYTSLLNANADIFLFYFPLLSYRMHSIVECNALPAAGSTSKIARLKLDSKFKLFGLITIAKQVYDNSAYAPGTHLAVDGVPGSTNPVTGEIPVKQRNMFIPIPGILGIWGYISVHVNGTPSNFTFVPVASAVDASPFNTNVFSQRYVGGINPAYPSSARTFIAQETVTGHPEQTNNVHIRFTARNSLWLYNEMEGVANTANCSSECNPPALTMLGGTSICSTTGTYSLKNIPAGTVVSWTSSNTGVATVPSTGNPVTVTKVSDGTTTITATINSCGGTISASKTNVAVGFPYFSNPISGGSVCWPNGNYTFTQPLPFGYPTPDDFQWTVPSGWTILSGQGTNTLYCNTGTTGGYVEVDVTACGVTRQNSKYVEIGSGDWWPDLVGGGDEEMRVAPPETTKRTVSATPNPANDIAVITINEAKTAAKGGVIEKKKGIKEIIIANKTGVVKRRLIFSGTQSSERINIRGLEPDIYVVQVNTGTEVLSCKLIVIK